MASSMDAGTDTSVPVAEAIDADALFEAVVQELTSRGTRLPRATYRVQFNQHFTFRQALDLLPYLHELGISDLYASPFFKARAGSLHGYDIVDHNALNPSIGSPEELASLASQLKALEMGQLLDVVPNHMGIGVRDNAWWMDVLENGPSSIYAPFFDIDWQPLKTELSNKVLLPILGDHYGRVLENGELQLQFAGGAILVRYYETVLPLNPGSYPRVLGAMIPILQDKLAPEDEAMLELQSIITGLTHLPSVTQLQPSNVMERRREKEILKRRLAALAEASPPVAASLERVITDINGEKGNPRSYDRFDALLEEQSYRVSFWRVAAEEVNYRRFFDVNDLAAIRMENPAVFTETHRTLLKLLGDGTVTGLRIDHPDGLWDPIRYFSALQRSHFLERCRRRVVAGDGTGADAFERLRPQLTARFDQESRVDPKSPLARPLYVVAEKILSRGETLPTEWPVHGTSGYDFASLLNGLFVDSASERAITSAYEAFTGVAIRFDELVYQKKKLVLQTSLASELNVLAAALNRLSERDRHSRDFTLGTLTDALREVIACFPVYRTYSGEQTETVIEYDRIAISRAVRLARQRNPTTDASVFAFLRSILALELSSSVSAEGRGQWREFVMKFQQLTGPVMAKGVEDTSFYIYNRLVSLNEVGGEPERFGITVSAFHQANAQRQRDWPSSLLATSTHDTKRSEDVRARISVLSELPERWAALLPELASLSTALKQELEDRRAPDANEEYLFYQTVLGTWPQGPREGAFDDQYIERIVAYMRKATKEAKVNTSWIDAAPEYDAAMEQFVRRALAPDSALREHLEPLARDVAYLGRFGALSQALLRMTSPGIPDTYQGTETWDFSLVDPDNRRPVDYRVRREMLHDVHNRAAEGVRFVRELLDQASDGRIKLFVIHQALEARRRLPRLFGADGHYVPLVATGQRADHVVAFARRDGESEIVVVAPRLTAKLVGGRPAPPIDGVWSETRLPVDEGRFRNLYTGEELTTNERDGVSHLPLEAVLQHFPVALLERIDGTRRGGERE
jgi:(1->4)-alpha-D-glucan 1-alpha-D-glucosylmutase